MVKLTFLNNICFLFGTSKNQEFEMSVQFWPLSFHCDRYKVTCHKDIEQTLVINVWCHLPGIAKLNKK